MKKVILFCACPLPVSDRAMSAAEASTPKRIAFFIGVLRSRLARFEPLSRTVMVRRGCDKWFDNRVQCIAARQQVDRVVVPAISGALRNGPTARSNRTGRCR